MSKGNGLVGTYDSQSASPLSFGVKPVLPVITRGAVLGRGDLVGTLTGLLAKATSAAQTSHKAAFGLFRFDLHLDRSDEVCTAAVVVLAVGLALGWSGEPCVRPVGSRPLSVEPIPIPLARL